MAWEDQGGRRYYYRSRKAGGRVVRDFLGNGVEAHLAAALVGERRRQEEDLRARREAQQTWAAASRPIDALNTITDLLVRATLLAAGYHQHHHSEWRRRRGRKR